METVQLCTAPTCARRAAPPRLLCWADRDRLARLLDPANHGGVDPSHPDRGHQPGGLAALYRDAAEVSHRTGTEAEHEHADHARLDDHGIAIRDARTTWAGRGQPRSVVAALGGWARIVHEERGDPLPKLAAPAWTEQLLAVPTADPDRLAAWARHRHPRAVPRPDVQAVTALCRWLHARVDWITTRPWVDELIVDLRDVAAQLRRGDARSRYIGPCSVPVDPDTGQPDPLSTTLCGGPLSVPSDGRRDPLAPLELPSIRCADCGSRWQGAELLRWARERGLAGAGLDEFLAGAPACPVHDLPPARPVRIRIAGTLHDGPAGEVCATWHQQFERTG